MSKKLTTLEFIARAKIIHNDKYNYDNAIYLGCLNKITITCKIHGDFRQICSDHLNGFGCAKCSGKFKLTTEDFIERATKIHGEKYIYDFVNYKSLNCKVEIICKLHGSFKQIAESHLNGHGCMFCAGNNKITTEIFKQKAGEIHNNFYSYNDAIYTGAHNNLIIKCPEHGNFVQQARTHLYGSGCSSCVYKNQTHIENFLKQNDIIFEQEFEINVKNNIRNIKVDFFIKSKNLIIEYNGRQHYEEVNWWNKSEIDSKVRFESQILRDKKVKEYCRLNNINLLEIDGRKYYANNLKKFLINFFKKENDGTIII